MSKAIEENKLTITIERLPCEFSFHWKFMCTNRNNGKNKTNLPLTPSTTVTVFFIAGKLLSVWL